MLDNNSIRFKFLIKTKRLGCFIVYQVMIHKNDAFLSCKRKRCFINFICIFYQSSLDINTLKKPVEEAYKTMTQARFQCWLYNWRTIQILLIFILNKGLYRKNIKELMTDHQTHVKVHVTSPSGLMYRKASGPRWWNWFSTRLMRCWTVISNPCRGRKLKLLLLRRMSPFTLSFQGETSSLGKVLLIM